MGGLAAAGMVAKREHGFRIRAVYTGDGKREDTAALGLALRAAGAGWKVFIAQFAKGTSSSELAALDRFADQITIRQYGRPGFIAQDRDQTDTDSAAVGLAECREAIASEQYRLVILDEANVAAMLHLFPIDRLLRVDRRSPSRRRVGHHRALRGPSPGHRPGRSGDRDAGSEALLPPWSDGPDRD